MGSNCACRGCRYVSVSFCFATRFRSERRDWLCRARGVRRDTTSCSHDIRGRAGHGRRTDPYSVGGRDWMGTRPSSLCAGTPAPQPHLVVSTSRSFPHHTGSFVWRREWPARNPMRGVCALRRNVFTRLRAGGILRVIALAGSAQGFCRSEVFRSHFRGCHRFSGALPSGWFKARRGLRDSRVRCKFSVVYVELYPHRRPGISGAHQHATVAGNSLLEQRIWKVLFEVMAKAELPLDRSITNWLLYPIFSIFNVIKQLEGGRTGLGVVSFLILPAAAIGILRKSDRRRELLIPLIIAGIFFTVWFFSGTTQRTRHLLSVYPLVLVTAFPAAIGWAQETRLLRPTSVGLSAALFIQLAGHSLFAVNHAKHVFSSETRWGFLDRNVNGANAAQWINENLSESARIGFMERQLAYLIEVPSFMIHPHLQAVIDARHNNSDEKRFVDQTQRLGLTHLLISEIWVNPRKTTFDREPFPV